MPHVGQHVIQLLEVEWVDTTLASLGVIVGLCLRRNHLDCKL